MRPRAGRLALALLPVALLLVSEPAAALCPMCRTALASPEGMILAAAFRRGILVLLAAPIAVVGVIATLVVRGARRRAAERA